MEVRYLITQKQLDAFNKASDQIHGFDYVISRVNRSPHGDGFILTIEGPENDIRLFVDRLRVMGVVLSA